MTFASVNHRFLNDLEEIENNQRFAGERINSSSNILIIGTFNPDDKDYVGDLSNNATWFYGRMTNMFWKILPEILVGHSLHPNDGHTGYPETWKDFCRKNKIVIIDIVKQIRTKDKLLNFSDNEINCLILHDLSNVEVFDIKKAFANIKFNKVIYSLKWSDRSLTRLKMIKDRIDNDLLSTQCIDGIDKIYLCKSPIVRTKPIGSWFDALQKA